MNLDRIPPELKELKQWVCTYEGSKVPMMADCYGSASSTNPQTWSSFENARVAVENGTYNYAGFVFNNNGIVGIETAFPVIYTDLVKKGVITLEETIELMSINPAKRFGLDAELKEGNPATLCVYDLEKEYTINPDEFISMGKSTPFKGKKVYGKCELTFHKGDLVWQAK
jgi:N-acetylglucosamine-6-phosphate deacetylase